MKEIKNLPSFSEALTPCHVVMINDHGLSSCFDTLKRSSRITRSISGTGHHA